MENHSMNYIVGVDIGGTFTDCVVIDNAGSITIGKALSTPPDFSRGALDAVGNAAELRGQFLLEQICWPSCGALFHTDLAEDRQETHTTER
jgi:N-methylhydantoinase A